MPRASLSVRYRETTSDRMRSLPPGQGLLGPQIVSSRNAEKSEFNLVGERVVCVNTLRGNGGNTLGGTDSRELKYTHTDELFRWHG